MNPWGRTVVCLSAVLMIWSVVAGGCAGGGVTIAAPGTDYVGPSVRLDSSPSLHQVVVAAPSPGWAVTMDSQDEQADARRVFITLRRPNPEMLYTQQIVEQRISTGVASDEAIRVLIRVLDFDQKRSPYVEVDAAGIAPVEAPES